MLHTLSTPGLLGDAELSYRRERLAADMGTSRRLAGWVGRLRRRSTPAASGELVLAA